MNKESSCAIKGFNNQDEIIYRRLKDMIVKIQVRPNEHLNIALLSTQFGVSITPVRTALKFLEYEELVWSIPKRGYFVSPINEKQVRDNHALRCSLEILAMKSAIHRIERSALEELIGQMEYRLEQNKVDGIYEPIYELDYSLHDLIIAHCNNEKLKSLYASMAGSIERSRNVIKYYKNPPSERWINEEIVGHIEIAKCMLARDLESAEVLLENHLKHITEYICTKISISDEQISGLWR